MGFKSAGRTRGGVVLCSSSMSVLLPFCWEPGVRDSGLQVACAVVWLEAKPDVQKLVRA